jgi:hypothetical protein
METTKVVWNFIDSCSVVLRFVTICVAHNDFEESHVSHESCLDQNL